MNNGKINQKKLKETLRKKYEGIKILEWWVNTIKIDHYIDFRQLNFSNENFEGKYFLRLGRVSSNSLLQEQNSHKKIVWLVTLQ